MRWPRCCWGYGIISRGDKRVRGREGACLRKTEPPLLSIEAAYVRLLGVLWRCLMRLPIRADGDYSDYNGIVTGVINRSTELNRHNSSHQV